MTRRLAPGLALIAALGLALAGCSGDKSDDKPTPAGPLEEFYKIAYGDYEGKSDEEWQAESEAQNQRYEEAIATCMRDQGFEYTPAVGNIQYVSMDDESGPQYGTLEYAKLYGYGYFDNPYNSEPDPDATEDVYVDPNQDYIESMSETEQQAYNEALYGEQPDWENVGEDEAVQWQPSGCQGEAQKEVYGDQMGLSDEDNPYADLEEAMNNMWTAMESDPARAELEAQWSSCMADAGYPDLKKTEDAQTAFTDKMNEAWNDQANVEQSADGSGGLKPEVEEKLKKEEIAQATADFSCREKIHYDEEVTKIMNRVQQEFVDQHRAELQQWAQYMAQQRESASPSAESQ